MMADPYSQIPLHSSSPLNPTPYGYDGPPLASRILYGDSTAVTKVMDGIFLGGIEAGQDLDFAQAHKITHIINCSGSSDILSQYGLKYLSLRWLEGSHGPGSIMFDPQGRNIQRIFKFIEGVRAKGEGVLIHSMDGNSRAVGVMMAYLMRKFKWGMTKTLEFIRLKRPHIHPSPILLKQLARAAQYLNLNPNDQHTTFAQRWIQHTPGMSTLETLLHHTFMNGHAIPVHAPGVDPVQAQAAQQRFAASAKRKKLVWIDEVPAGTNAAAVPSSPGLKRTSMRANVNDDDDEDEWNERQASNRLMQKALGVHYNSSMLNAMHSNQSPATAMHNGQQITSIIRPSGAQYSHKPTSIEIKQKPLLKMQHLQQLPHFSFSLSVSPAANNPPPATATLGVVQPSPQLAPSTLRPPSPMQAPAASPAASPASARPLSAQQRQQPPSPLGPSPLNKPSLTPMSLSGTSVGGGGSSSLTATTALNSNNVTSRSTWTPEKELHRSGSQSAAHGFAADSPAMAPVAGASPALSSLNSLSGMAPPSITSSTSGSNSSGGSSLALHGPSSNLHAAPPFAKSVPGRPVVPNYRPSTASSNVGAGATPTASLNLTSHAAAAMLNSSGTSSLRGSLNGASASSTLDDVNDNFSTFNVSGLPANGSVSSSGSHAPSPSLTPSQSVRRMSLGARDQKPPSPAVNPQPTPPPVAQLTPTSSSANLANAATPSAFNLSSPNPYASGGTSSLSASPQASPSAAGAGSFFNGLAGRPLRSSGSAASTPTSSTGNLLSNPAPTQLNPNTASSMASTPSSSAANGHSTSSAGVPSPYSFMSSPSLSSHSLTSTTTSSGMNGPGSHHPLATASPKQAPLRPNSAPNGATPTAPLKLSSTGAPAFSTLSAPRAPLTASPSSVTAPRLATLMQGGANPNSSPQQAPTTLNGNYSSFASNNTTPFTASSAAHNSDMDGVSTSARPSSAGHFSGGSRGARASGSAAAAAVGTGVSGSSVGSTFVGQGYSSSNPSSTSSSAVGASALAASSPFNTSAAGFYSRSNNSNTSAGASSAFASSGIAAPPSSGSSASTNSGVIQWWVQEPKSSSTLSGSNGSVSHHAGMNSASMDGATDKNSAGGGAYPTSISSQSMLMFQKAKSNGSTGGGSAGPSTPQKAAAVSASAAAGSASSLSVGGGGGGAGAYSAFQAQQASTSATLSFNASQKLRDNKSVPSPKTVGKGLGSSNAAGFYSSTAGNNWPSTTGSNSAAAPASTLGSGPSPYPFFNGNGSAGGLGSSSSGYGAGAGGAPPSPFSSTAAVTSAGFKGSKHIAASSTAGSGGGMGTNQKLLGGNTGLGSLGGGIVGSAKPKQKPLKPTFASSGQTRPGSSGGSSSNFINGFSPSLGISGFPTSQQNTTPLQQAAIRKAAAEGLYGGRFLQ